MTHTRDPSALSQVVEYLQEQAVGRVIFAPEAHEALPHLATAHVSAALSLLASPRYAVLTKLDKIGRHQAYQITSLVRSEWNGHARPRRHGGERRPRRPRAEASQSTRAHAAELLLAAAVMAEDGEALDDVLDTIRSAYYELKPRRTP